MSRGYDIAATEHTPKACPFCGANDSRVPNIGAASFWVECGGCGAEGPYRPTEAEAIAAWNTRAEAGVVRELVEASKQIAESLSHATDGSYIGNPDREHLKRFYAALAKAGAA